MLGLDKIDSDADSSDVPLSNRMCRLLSITWRADDGTITPSEVSQKHLCEALRQWRQAESMGYATAEDTTAINNRKLVIFRKWPYVNLSEDSQKQLK